MPLITSTQWCDVEDHMSARSALIWRGVLVGRHWRLLWGCRGGPRRRTAFSTPTANRASSSSCAARRQRLVSQMARMKGGKAGRSWSTFPSVWALPMRWVGMIAPHPRLSTHVCSRCFLSVAIAAQYSAPKAGLGLQIHLYARMTVTTSANYVGESQDDVAGCKSTMHFYQSWTYVLPLNNSLSAWIIQAVCCRSAQ